MKIYAPKTLRGADLRILLDDLFCTPAQAAKVLKVSERTVWRWLADNSAPYAVLSALWHETPTGRECAALDVGNELAIVRGLASGRGDALKAEAARLAYLARLGDFGAANDPLFDGGLLFQAPVVSRNPGAAVILSRCVGLTGRVTVAACLPIGS